MKWWSLWLLVAGITGFFGLMVNPGYGEYYAGYMYPQPYAYPYAVPVYQTYYVVTPQPVVVVPQPYLYYQMPSYTMNYPYTVTNNHGTNHTNVDAQSANSSGTSTSVPVQTSVAQPGSYSTLVGTVCASAIAGAVLWAVVSKKILAPLWAPPYPVKPGKVLKPEQIDLDNPERDMDRLFNEP